MTAGNSENSTLPAGRPLLPALKVAYAAVFTKLPALTRLATVPIAFTMVIGLTTALLQPLLLELLARALGSQAATMLHMAGLKARLDLALSLVPASIFAVAWLRYLNDGEIPKLSAVFGSSAFQRFLRLSPLILIYPAITYLSSTYITYAFVFHQNPGGFEFEMRGYYGWIAGILVEAVILGRMAPALVAAALDEGTEPRPAIQPAVGRVLRDGLGWFLTYRIVAVLLLYLYWPVAREGFISDFTFIKLLYGTSTLEDRLLYELVAVPALLAFFLSLALGLAFAHAVTGVERRSTISVFD
jgi:hypothetical protein